MAKQPTLNADIAPTRQKRSDAKRNEEIILEAAKHCFQVSGVDAPVRDIATLAGVGVGTLYRRFPNRSDLIVAVFRREVDICTKEASELAKTHLPVEALMQWLRRYMQFISTKRGLAAALHSGDPSFEALPAYFRANFEPALASLLTAAAVTGDIRSGIRPYDLLRAIGNLSASSGAEGADHAQTMVELLLDGLRFGATKVD